MIHSFEDFGTDESNLKSTLQFEHYIKILKCAFTEVGRRLFWQTSNIGSEMVVVSIGYLLTEIFSKGPFTRGRVTLLLGPSERHNKRQSLMLECVFFVWTTN